MSREVKRVPMSFDWEINKAWSGYLIGGYCDAVKNDCEFCKKFFSQLDVDFNDGCDAPSLNIEPPEGEGWQMWETVSEGSPISPVFDTPEKLAKWLSDNVASSFGSSTATYDQWLHMIKGSGWSPSGVLVPGKGFMSGVEAYSELDKA